MDQQVNQVILQPSPLAWRFFDLIAIDNNKVVVFTSVEVVRFTNSALA